MTSAYPQDWPVTVVEGRVPQALWAEVRELLEAAEESDGNPSLSEQTTVLMRSPETHNEEILTVAVHALDDTSGSSVPEDLAGVAAISFSPDGTGVAELAVHPNYRNQGVGVRLVEAIRELRGSAGLKGLRAWSHGNHEAAAELALDYGFVPERELWKMVLVHRPHADSPALPEGVSIRTFEPGRDEDAWLAANHAAFAHHPEQGQLRRSDLEARMAEDWFDPAGFFLAVDEDDRILGFHWTKVHPAHGEHRALGEVYVVGVVPEAQGNGLGRALTLHGIDYLHSLGLGTVMLYTDADNLPAVAMYRRLGFTLWDRDVLYTAS
ncbi:mycothiol acetyltransferase [Sinomonas cellulolyticus]|uniref:Mycothiol acetyltransferase n=1 Tax=Sinomonas cellulolyticus TaxID=2801916 RepID=A0ABS1JY21_9MICC|nr:MULTISPECIES: mycothiol synthase [Sinomonas]MBL0704279.1 mycothiol synthase [Sinomonas cellulolyticus]GHG58712.1 mycothiol acetyltransferase [Sinomonas sp. KCTC 49339]